MKLKPLADRVVVEPLDPESKSKGGIIIPDTAQQKSQRGRVLAVGPGRWNDETGKRQPMSLEVGQTILYSRYAGSEFELDGDKVLVLGESEVLAVVE